MYPQIYIIQARLNVPNSTPQFEVAGTMEYIDGHDAGFYFIGYSECRVPCKLALFSQICNLDLTGGGRVVQVLLIFKLDVIKHSFVTLNAY